MKLSQIKGDRAFEVMAEIIDPVANIATDKEAGKLFSKAKLPEGADPKEFLLNRIKQHLPYLLKTHKANIMTILAAIGGVPYEEYASQLSIVKLLSDCTELLNDEDFKALFFSAQSGNTSGSVQENTTDRPQ